MILRKGKSVGDAQGTAEQQGDAPKSDDKTARERLEEDALQWDHKGM